MEMVLPEFTAVLDEMTRNTYVLVVVHDPRIGAFLSASFVRRSLAGPGDRSCMADGVTVCSVTEPAALKLNIRLARQKFEELQGNSIS